MACNCGEIIVDGRLIMWSVGFRDAAQGWHVFVLGARGATRDVATGLPSYEDAIKAGPDAVRADALELKLEAVA